MYTLTEFSYRSADIVIANAAGIREEIKSAMQGFGGCAGPESNARMADILKERLTEVGWQEVPSTFFLLDDSPRRCKLLKDRTAIIVEFGEPAYFGMDMLRFQLYSPADKNHIDAGVYVLPTRNFQERMREDASAEWSDTLTFERVREYMPQLKSVIQVPICVLGIDCAPGT